MKKFENLDEMKMTIELQQEELIMRRKYEAFLKSIIRSGEKLSDNETFEWFIR